MTETTQWYGCGACGEMRKFPFEAYSDDSGCRCPTAAQVRAAAAKESQGRAIAVRDPRNMPEKVPAPTR
jgi:hypothetical protein